MYVVVEGSEGSGRDIVYKAFGEILVEKGLRVFDVWGFTKNTRYLPEFGHVERFGVVCVREPTGFGAGQALLDEILPDNKRDYSVRTIIHASAVDRDVLFKRLLTQLIDQRKGSYDTHLLQKGSLFSSLVCYPILAGVKGDKSIGMSELLSYEGNSLAFADENVPDHLVVATASPEAAWERLQNRPFFVEPMSNFYRAMAEGFKSTNLKNIFEQKGTKVHYLNTEENAEQRARMLLEEIL